MSQDTPENEIDLIDFHIKSPVLPRATPSFETNSDTCENLIDTELPILEKKLQAAESFSSPASDHRTTVDIEDILIALDDESDCDASNDKRNDVSNRIVVDNNVELLDILKNLDDVLNACLVESDQNLVGKTNNCSKEHAEKYLYNNSGYCSDNDDENDLESRLSSRNCSPVDDITDAIDGKDAVDIRSKLRHFEENYNKFLSSGYVNRAYVNTEPSSGRRRPLSACDVHHQEEGVEYPRRATVGFPRRKRSPLYHKNGDYEYNVHQPSRSTADSDDDIDWSWLEDVARDINLVTCECETPRRNSITAEEYSRSEEQDNSPQTGNAVLAMRLRDSMRRLDPLLIPSVSTSYDDDRNALPNLETTNPVLQLQTSVHERPSILTNTASSSSRPPTSRASRSRSCDSRSAERRPRSSFSSTRSRRPRSLSSSLSSVSSSAESSPSFNPSASPTDNNPQTNTNTSSPRR